MLSLFIVLTLSQQRCHFGHVRLLKLNLQAFSVKAEDSEIKEVLQSELLAL